jgi:hypothetical protein
MDARGLYQVLIQVFEADLCTSKLSASCPVGFQRPWGLPRKKKAPPGRSQLIDHRARPDMRVRERPDPMTLPKCWLYRIEQFDEIAR